MEQQKCAQLISACLKNLYAFSLSKLYDKSEAEDLTNDIIYEVLKSSNRLRNDDAFYGFMWRIAENTFKKHIKKNKTTFVSFDEAFVGAYLVTPEDELAASEEINILRRELSLLSKQYREVTVAYYFNGKSCSEISKELSISMDMVKYYLFKTRKLLKEGFGMTREYGEKSYNPGTFRMDYWGGGDNSCYWELFKRKLPGNIVLSAYDAPVTLQELSIELGVAAVYLEEEIEILMKHDILTKIGEKYQTNIIIFTDSYEKDVAAKIAPIYKAAAQKFNAELDELLPELSALDFKGNHYNKNRLKWAFANIALVFALNLSDAKVRDRFGDYPSLSNGSFGFVFGYDNDYQNHHFNGIYGHCENQEKTAYFSVENYRAIEKCQQWKPVNWDKAVEAMCDAILEKAPDENNEMLLRLIDENFIFVSDNKLSVNFPVFYAETIEKRIWEILKPISEKLCDCMTEICDTAAQTLKNYVPKALAEKCDQICYIHHQMDVMAFVIEEHIEQNLLKLTDNTEKLCVFGVRR
ncbi:sigma-70 family RNA polymerase sigma factor [Eubacteriales bacterium OttesenSCG-928-G02]|nr:sigma-70 family RNA polymerase sigma factor [Eubacteriales bacterium OttesenSCG-928-G02]